MYFSEYTSYCIYSKYTWLRPCPQYCVFV